MPGFFVLSFLCVLVCAFEQNKDNKAIQPQLVAVSVAGYGDQPPPPPSYGYQPSTGYGDQPPPPPSGYQPPTYESSYQPPPSESSYQPATEDLPPPPPPEIPPPPPEIPPEIPPPSGPLDCSKVVCLSVQCNHPLANQFGRPRAYTIFGYSGGVFLSGASGVAGISNSEGDATKLYVVPVLPEQAITRALQYKQEFYLVTANGLYLERYARISQETNNDLPHQSARFNLAFVNAPTQTWKVDYNKQGDVLQNDRVGITIAGVGTDWTLPNNNLRRTLTLRGGDGISVVVQWWQADENVAFKASSFIATAPTCSPANPFAFVDADCEKSVCLSLPCTDPFASVFGNPIAYTVFRGQSGSNLALNQPVTASSTLSTAYTADKAVDGDLSTRWTPPSVAAGTTTTFRVDLGSVQAISLFRIHWENNHGTIYKIEGSNDDNSWNVIINKNDGNKNSNANVVDEFSSSVSYRYVRIAITDGYCCGGVRTYCGSIYEFQVIGANLASGKTAFASNAASGYPASNAVDGSGSTRWAPSGASNPLFFGVDLGSPYSINQVVISWENNHATEYILEGSLDGSNYNTITTRTGGDVQATAAVDVLNGNNYNARYVRIRITAGFCCGGKNTGAGSIWEFQVSGSVYISGESGVAGVTSDEASASKLYVVPAQPDTVWTRALQYKQDFYLVTPDGKYLERAQRISQETPSDLPHQSARFNLGFASTPTQTWRVDYDGTGDVPNTKNIGLSIAGTGTDWSLPNNNIRRVLTLRSSDGLSVVVQWWKSDEQVAFQRNAFFTVSPTSACNPATPFALPPLPTGNGVQLSVPCTHPLSKRFGLAVAYRLFGYAGNVYVSQSSATVAGFTTNVDSALELFVVPANAGAVKTRVLQYGQEFYLMNRQGQYLQRFQRISTETPSNLPHQSARFNLGFATSPSQTWRVDFTGSGGVPESANIGVSIAGSNTDWAQPDNNIRRVLTLRASDGISVVVQWWQSDEQVALQRLPALLPGTCSSGGRFPLAPLPPATIGDYIQLSLPCADPLSARFGNPQPYTLYGYTGAYVKASIGGAAGVTTLVSNATEFLVVPVDPAGVTTRLLQGGQEFYLVTKDGFYLQRFQRIGSETISSVPFLSARFNTGLSAKGTQTWKVDYGASTGGVLTTAKIGLSLAGSNTDWTHPDNNVRRLLTVRPSDATTVLVKAWNGDEQVGLRVAPSAACQ